MVTFGNRRRPDGFAARNTVSRGVTTRMVSGGQGVQKLTVDRIMCTVTKRHRSERSQTAFVPQTPAVTAIPLETDLSPWLLHVTVAAQHISRDSTTVISRMTSSPTMTVILYGKDREET